MYQKIGSPHPGAAFLDELNKPSCVGNIPVVKGKWSLAIEGEFNTEDLEHIAACILMGHVQGELVKFEGPSPMEKLMDLLNERVFINGRDSDGKDKCC